MRKSFPRAAEQAPGRGKMLRPGGGADRPQGLLFHWVMGTDDGIRLTDVWESKDELDQFPQTSVVPMIQEVGLAGPPDVRFFDVHIHL